MNDESKTFFFQCTAGGQVFEQVVYDNGQKNGQP